MYDADGSDVADETKQGSHFQHNLVGQLSVFGCFGNKAGEMTVRTNPCSGVYVSDQDIEESAECLLDELQRDMGSIDSLCDFSVRMDDDHFVLEWNNQNIDQLPRTDRIHKNLRPAFKRLCASMSLNQITYLNPLIIIRRMLVYMCCKIWDDDFLKYYSNKQIAKRDAAMFAECFDKSDNFLVNEALHDILMLQYKSFADMMMHHRIVIVNMVSKSLKFSDVLFFNLKRQDFNQERAPYMMRLYKIMQNVQDVIYKLAKMMDLCFLPPSCLVFPHRVAIVDLVKKHGACIGKICAYLQNIAEFSQKYNVIEGRFAFILNQKHQGIQQDIHRLNVNGCCEKLMKECHCFSVELKKYIENITSDAVMSKVIEGTPVEPVDGRTIIHAADEEMSRVVLKSPNTPAEIMPVDLAELVQQEMFVKSAEIVDGQTIINLADENMFRAMFVKKSPNTPAKIMPVNSAELVIGQPRSISNVKKTILSVVVTLCTIIIITVSALLAVMAVIHFAAFIVIGIAAVAICIMLLVKIISVKKSLDGKPLVTGQMDEINEEVCSRCPISHS